MPPLRPPGSLARVKSARLPTETLQDLKATVVLITVNLKNLLRNGMNACALSAPLRLMSTELEVMRMGLLCMSFSG